MYGLLFLIVISTTLKVDSPNTEELRHTRNISKMYELHHEVHEQSIPLLEYDMTIMKFSMPLLEHVMTTMRYSMPLLEHVMSLIRYSMPLLEHVMTIMSPSHDSF